MEKSSLSYMLWIESKVSARRWYPNTASHAQINTRFKFERDLISPFHPLCGSAKWHTMMKNHSSIASATDSLARSPPYVSDAQKWSWRSDQLQIHHHQGFEELLSSTNVLNRKLEEVLGMTKEYDTIASLWHSFYQLMRNSAQEDASQPEEQAGLPGTGGHVVSTNSRSGKQQESS